MILKESRSMKDLDIFPNEQDFNPDGTLIWSWDIKNDLFKISSIDDEHIPLHIDSIEHIEDFVSILETWSKEPAINLFKRCLTNNEIHCTNISFNNDKVRSFYCLLKASKVNDSTITGLIRPLIPTLDNIDTSALFYQLVSNNHHGIIITNEDTEILTCNNYIQKSMGYTQEELIGKPTSIFSSSKHGKMFYTDMWSNITNQGYWSGHILSRKKDGRCIPQDLTIQKMIVGNDTLYLGIALDLSNELYRVEDKDNGGIELLTQLPSKNEFKRSLNEISSKIENTTGLLVIAFTPKFDLICDLDDKRQIASTISFYKEKVAAGYLGGNTFSVAMTYSILDSTSNSSIVYKPIKSLANYLRGELDYKVFNRIAKCNIGVSVLNTDANSANKLISHALQAMYENHNETGTNISFYNQQLHEIVKRREMLEEIVRLSIKENSLIVYYQPIISTNDWKVISFEALCRFKDKNGAELDTQEMILIAEDLGLIGELDLAVAAKALSDRQHLTKYFGDEIGITINFSANTNVPITRTFSNINTILNNHPETLPHVTIELTETGYFNNKELTSDVLSKLRDRGVALAIDDFGTGYSSFSYLKDNNIDILKIDRKYIIDIKENSSNYHIVKMMINLSHTLNVKVVAEGVETLQELSILKDLKVDFVQGYYFSPPLPINKTKPYVAYKKIISEICGIGLDKQTSCIIMSQDTVSTDDDLFLVKVIFEKSQQLVIAVLNNKKCVGYIERSDYNLHINPAVGSNIESSDDLRLLQKRTHQIMNTKFTTIDSNFTNQELFSKIKSGIRFPWIVQDKDEEFIGMVTHESAMNFLASIL